MKKALIACLFLVIMMTSVITNVGLAQQNTQTEQFPGSMEKLYELKNHRGYAIAWRPDGSAVIVGTGGIVYFDGKSFRFEEMSVVFKSATWKPDGSYVLLTGFPFNVWEELVMKYDGRSTTTLLKVPSKATKELGEPYNTAAWKTDGSYALIGNRVGEVLKYDGKQFDSMGVVVKEFGGVYMIRWKPNGDYALLSGYGVIYSYDGTTFKRFETPLGNSGYPSIVEWKPDGEYALIAQENQLYKFDGTKISILLTITEGELWGITNVSWKPDGSYALLLGGRGLYKFDEKSVSKLTKIADERLGIERLGTVSWHPDGTYALVTSYYYEKVSESKSEIKAQIYKYTDEVTPPTLSDVTIDWMKEGKYVTYDMKAEGKKDTVMATATYNLEYKIIKVDIPYVQVNVDVKNLNVPSNFPFREFVKSLESWNTELKINIEDPSKSEPVGYEWVMISFWFPSEILQMMKRSLGESLSITQVSIEIRDSIYQCYLVETTSFAFWVEQNTGIVIKNKVMSTGADGETLTVISEFKDTNIEALKLGPKPVDWQIIATEKLPETVTVKLSPQKVEEVKRSKIVTKFKVVPVPETAFNLLKEIRDTMIKENYPYIPLITDIAERAKSIELAGISADDAETIYLIPNAWGLYWATNDPKRLDPDGSLTFKFHYQFYVILASKADLLVYTDKGKVGSVYENGKWDRDVNEVPEAFYSGHGSHPNIALLPANVTIKKTEVNSEEPGKFDIVVGGIGQKVSINTQTSGEIKTGETVRYVIVESKIIIETVTTATTTTSVSTSTTTIPVAQPQQDNPLILPSVIIAVAVVVAAVILRGRKPRPKQT